MGRPHVVLLGAGASRAAFPRGERNGKRRCFGRAASRSY